MYSPLTSPRLIHLDVLPRCRCVLRRVMSQYTAAHSTLGGRGGAIKASTAEAALVKLTSGLSDVSVKYATVSGKTCKKDIAVY